MQFVAVKRAARSYRAERKGEPRNQGDGELKPYERVELVIDDLLAQTGNIKVELDEFVAEGERQTRA